MAGAATDSAVLAGGAGDLYPSTDQGESFSRVGGMSVSDVHGLGASRKTVYLTSPEGGVLTFDR